MGIPLIFRKKVIVFLGTSENVARYKSLIETLNRTGFIVYFANSNNSFFGLSETIDALIIVGDGRQFTDMIASYQGQLKKIMYIWTLFDPQIPNVKSIEWSYDSRSLLFEITHLLGYN